MASAGLRDLFATSSDIASLPEPQRSRLLARIGELAAELPETVELAERSDGHLWFRGGSGGWASRRRSSSRSGATCTCGSETVRAVSPSRPEERCAAASVPGECGEG